MRKIVAAALALACMAGVPARAQVATRPHLDWRTVRTPHFTVHYPAEMAAWTLDLVPRLEAAHDAVAAIVGYAPPGRVTILVEDPSAQSNGFAYSFLDEPTIALWPTPSEPRSVIGNTRDPAEQLVEHELTHIAHLTRPSRNPTRRFFARLLPVRLGPVAMKAPRWVSEGYATYVEGKLSGSGRPYSVARAAVLRQWALEGRLPRYEQLDAGSGFQGGAMAYLAGSAFLEWLVRQRGEQSLPNLWRRMSARRDRTFDVAFAGVFGGTPNELYGRFTVDVTERALAARAALRAAGLAVGDTIQHLGWSTGDPAVSPDGQTMAVVLRGATPASSRVVVWRTADERPDTAARARAARALLARDPEDVPDVAPAHPGKRALATLYPVDGRAHDQPRFMPDGAGILLVRSEPTGDGAFRPDLFLWDWKKKTLRRITHGASVRWPDPAPDGRTAAAIRCAGGICGLATVDLASGAVHTLAAAGPNVVFYRPRWSPDGSTIAVAMHQRDVWRIALVDPHTGALRYVGPDDGASRYDAAFLPGGRALVEVSERGGIANVETLDLATGVTRTVTRLTGAAAAPEPQRGTDRVWFLSLHSRGLDVMRIALDSAAPGPVVALDTTLAPAAPRVAATMPDTLPRGPLPPSHAYGLGPRRFRLLPEATVDADGGSAGLLLLNGDPVGRLTWMLRGRDGRAGMPRGAALSLVYRRWIPSVGLDLFAMEQRASELRHPLLDPADSLDARYGGAALYVESPWAGTPLRRRLRGGLSSAALEVEDGDTGSRTLAFAEATGAWTVSRGTTSLAMTATANGSAGRTLGAGWTRGIGTAAARVRFSGLNARGAVTYGAVSSGAPAWERFVVGGGRAELFDAALTPQRVPMPLARMGVVRGRELLTWRASTDLNGVTPYVAGASGDAGHRTWYRIVGVEAAFGTPPLNLLRLPAVHVVAGVGEPLTAPDRHKLRVYGGVSYRP
jgi:Tol biopolymer transport system component